MVVCAKKRKHCLPDELGKVDCWIGVSLVKESGLILSARVGKHTDAVLTELMTSPEGKISAKIWYTDGWGGYERVLPLEVTHIMGKENTQRVEHTNGIVRQQTGR